MPAHFEIFVADVDAAKAFYGPLLGWTFQPMPGGEDINYNLVIAPDIGPGNALTGGLVQRPDATPAAGGPIRGCTLTVEVDDCDAIYAKALATGGSEALPPTDFPGIGRCAYMEDGQGNVFGVITPEKEA